MSKVKVQLLDAITQKINHKISTLESLINSAKESRDSETKSTVGDKYETARAMAQMEIQKSENQRNQLQRQLDEIGKIDVSDRFTQGAFGSLILTDEGSYFIATGLGKITLGQELFFVISLASPIGNILKDKKVGDVFRFNGKNITIEAIG